MIFHNPWGLLALVSIPVILALHFFREKRKTRKIGGLHLWEFAAIRLPAGRRFDRLIKNLPLLFQILAALLLSLLIAGLDIPLSRQMQHYTVILDDSVSMQAGETESSKDRAKHILKKWAGKKNKFTLIAAGTQTKILAGPFAGIDEFLHALDIWEPRAPSCDPEKSVNLASQFITGEEKILFVTDDKKLAEPFAEILECCSVGKPLPNFSISFADRVRILPDKDKVFVTLQNFSLEQSETKLFAKVNKETVFEQNVKLPPEKPLTITFETPNVQDRISLEIQNDSLNQDNRATLLPVIIKPVNVFVDDFEAQTPYFIKAVASVPYTNIVEKLGSAELVFSLNPVFNPFTKNVRVYVFPQPEKVQNPLLAEGRDIVFDHNSPLTQNLSLDGVLWLYSKTGEDIPGFPLISYRGAPLLYRESEDDFFRQYRFNLLWDRTNIFRHPSFPTLVLSMVEDARESMPGLTRSNFRVGESIPLRIKIDENEKKQCEITRNGESFSVYEQVPEVLSFLPDGFYELRRGKEQVLASFYVNLFSPAESDLRTLVSKKPDFSRLVPATVARTQQSMFLFYILLLSIFIFTALAWVFQE